MATPDVNVKITADASGVTKGVAVAQGALAKLQKQMGDLESLSAKSLSFSGLAGIGLSATAAAAALFGITKAAADYGDQLDNLSQRTGIAVEDLAKLQYAAKMSDTSTEALTKGVTNLSNLMVAAAGGAAESSALFERYGIAVRNADGSMRGAYDVLGDVADVFSTMPDGVEKTALATEFFGKKLGVELIPLLNQGSEGLKKLGDEAERLGLVMSSDQAKAAAEFNDNLDKLSALAGAAGKSIGNLLIPHINTFLQKLMLARDNGLSIGQILFDVLPDQGGDFDQQFARVSAALDALKKKRQEALASNAQDGGSIYTSGMEAEIAKQEKLLAYISAQRKKSTVDETADSAKRALMAGQLANKLAELEQLRAIASGKASADVLKSDKDLNAARLKDAESLRDALRTAYQASVDEARKATDEAAKLFDKARAKRNSSADKAFDKSLTGLSEEDKAVAYGQQAQGMFDQGRYYAAAAGAAQLDGRVKEAEAYAKKAEEFLARAESFADKTTDTGLIQGIAEAQAQMYEAQAKAKEQEAAGAQQRAAAQMATLNQVEAKIKELQTAAANFEIKANVTQLETDIARLRSDIEKGATLPVRLGLEDIQKFGTPASPEASTTPGFATGGFTGWLGRQQVAGVVHGQEFVTRAGVTLQPGVLPFLEALNRYGNKVLPGYENGGLVRSLPGGSQPAASSGTPLVLDFGKLGRYQAEAAPDTADALLRVFKRAAWANGRR